MPSAGFQVGGGPTQHLQTSTSRVHRHNDKTSQALRGVPCLHVQMVPGGDDRGTSGEAGLEAPEGLHTGAGQHAATLGSPGLEAFTGARFKVQLTGEG